MQLATYEIHPEIGVAQLGNSATDFDLAPDEDAGMPIEVAPLFRTDLERLSLRRRIFRPSHTGHVKALH